jgi:hypothetical protein
MDMKAGFPVIAICLVAISLSPDLPFLLLFQSLALKSVPFGTEGIKNDQI